MSLTTPEEPPESPKGGEGEVLLVKELGGGNLLQGTSARPNNSFYPPWLNVELSHKGQRVYQKYLGSVGISAIFSGLFFALLPQGAEIILFTGNSTVNEKMARRSIATGAQILLWAKHLLHHCTNSQSSEIANTSIVNVRQRHMAVAQQYFKAQRRNGGVEAELEKQSGSYALRHTAFWDALEDDLHQSPIPAALREWPESYATTVGEAIPLNQFLMGMVQWTLIGVLVGFSKAFGLHRLSEEEEAGLSQFYALTGYALGVEDEYNVSLLTKEHRTNKERYNAVFKTYFIPALFQRTECSKIVTELGGYAGGETVLAFFFCLNRCKWFVHYTVQSALEFFHVRMLRDLLEIEPNSILSNATIVTRVLTVYWEWIFIPMTRIPGFHWFFTPICRFIMWFQGINVFGIHYGNDKYKSLHVYT